MKKTESAAEYERVRLLTVANEALEPRLSIIKRRSIGMSETPLSVERDLVQSDKKLKEEPKIGKTINPNS